MNPKVKSKLLDIFNSSFSEKNNLNKSQGNIILDTDNFFKRNIKNSSSLPKFPQYNYVNRSSKKDKIKDMLNKSFTELGFTNTRNNNKKTLFDNINTSTENYFGGKKLIVEHKEFDYDNFFKKIDEKKKKKNLNDITNFNNENNTIMNRYLNGRNNNINYKNLKKKISAFANELLIENPIKEKSYLNKQILYINNNNGNYSSPFNKKRINNFSSNNFISQIYNSNPSSSNTYNNSLKKNSKNFLDDLFNKTSQYSNQGKYRKNNNNDDLFNDLMSKFDKKKVNKPYYFNNQKSPIGKINLNF